MIESGAVGYLIKGASITQIATQIRRAALRARHKPAGAVLDDGFESPAPRPGDGAGLPIRVLIADDSEDILRVLGDLVLADPSLELVGLARDAAHAVRLAELYEPHVALLDWRMPAGGGEHAAREIRRGSPATHVVGLSFSSDPAAVMSMLRAGAAGYLVKSTSGEEIMEAIRRAADGEQTLSREVASPVVEELVVHLEREQEEAERRQRRLRRLRRALEGDVMSMVFQPIFQLERNEVIGMEALARFDAEPRRPPDVWFREAATAGLGVELDISAARRAVEAFADWEPELDLFVNLSPETLMSGQAGDLLERLSPERLILEVTEHHAVYDYDLLNDAMQPLRDKGVRLGVDDVGAGFSSLRHILNLHPDLIKLDLSLCRSIDSDSARHTLTGALVGFAGEIDATVVAEGVETKLEIDALRGLGVEFAQGYFLGRPGALLSADTGAATA